MNGTGNETRNYLRKKGKPRPAAFRHVLISSPYLVEAYHRYGRMKWVGHIIGIEDEIVRDLDDRGWKVSKILKGRYPL